MRGGSVVHFYHPKNVDSTHYLILWPLSIKQADCLRSKESLCSHFNGDSRIINELAEQVADLGLHSLADTAL